MASLTGTKIKDTYDGLLKTTDNGVLGASAKLITDGLGNSSGVYLGTSGDVGIGTGTPLATAHIKSGNSGLVGSLNVNYDNLAVEGGANTGITILSPNSNNAGIAFSDNDAQAQGLILYGHADDFMAFRTAGTERMRILSTGGLTFNGDTAAANALNDYEEGSFIPVVADAETGGNVGSGTLNGNYIKIGKQVTVVIQCSNIETTGMTAGDALWVRGLPYTSGSFTGSPQWIGATRVSAITAVANSLGFTAMITENSTALRIMENIDSLNSAAILVSSINSGASDIWITLTYFV